MSPLEKMYCGQNKTIKQKDKTRNRERERVNQKCIYFILIYIFIVLLACVTSNMMHQIVLI